MNRRSIFKNTAATLLVAASLFSAGNKAHGQITWGPKAGININKLSFDNAKAITGFTGGGFVEVKFLNRIGVQAEVLYSQQGGKVDAVWIGDRPLNENRKYKTQYLNIPVMINGYVTPRLAFKVGVQAGFLLQAKESVYFRDGTGSSSKVKSFFTNAEFSIPVGLSYDIWNFVLDARYNIGVTNVSSGNRESARNNVWAITLGYRF